MNLIPCGTIVMIKMCEFHGMITAINIRFDKVQYEVSYFVEGEKRCEWMAEFEFEFNCNSEKYKIGFKK